MKKADPKTIIGAIFLVIVFLLVFSFCSNLGNSSSTDSKSSTYTAKYVATGDRGYINASTYAGVTKDDLDLLISYMNADNNDGITELLFEGKIFSIKEGTEVNVTNKKFAVVEFSSTTGKGWVPIELVSKK
jgi:hypothetical protein